MSKVKVGSYTGNGSIQNIELGFRPDFLNIINTTDGDAQEFWYYGMTEDTGISHGSSSLATNSADSITVFHGEAPFKTLTGLYSIADAATALTGVSTLMETELKVGDQIRIGDQEFTIASITSATAATVSAAASGAESSVIGVRVNGRAEGFTVGTDLSEDAKVFRFLAVGND